MSKNLAPVRTTLMKFGLDMQGNLTEGLTWETPVKIFPRVNIHNVEMGAYSYIAPSTELNCVSIGRYCSIGPNGKLFGSAHPTRWLSSHPFTHQNIFRSFADYDPALSFEPYSRYTEIGHDVWIGTNVVVLPGVKIGNGAVIGAGAVVAKDVPDYAVVVGNPGKVVKYRFSKQLVERLQAVQWWQFDLPRYMEAHPDLPFDQPEAMLDYIEAHGDSIPKLTGERKELLFTPKGLAVRALSAAAQQAAA